MKTPPSTSLRRVATRIASFALLVVAEIAAANAPPPIAWFQTLVGDSELDAAQALENIDRQWHPTSIALLVEALPFSAGVNTSQKILTVLQKNTNAPLAENMNGLYAWLWQSERPEHPDYAAFKADQLGQVDVRFREHFQGKPTSLIRYDEIRWGGVRRDGIPPLKNPKMISAKDAKWLGDDHVVFGVAINGDVRAYPKRILAWHEMFKDVIGGVDVTGVYCTLCGSLIMYDNVHNGARHELGTSGFLYRSNKLMYDHGTKSLWSTLEGTPVLGPLVNKGITLQPLHVVTTTWKAWRTRHPNTQVLSLDTGHERDYGEGVAYREYFATDKLMFNVPKLDQRLKNKAEVLALRNPRAPYDALAFDANYLQANPVVHAQVGKRELVVLTDASGANRVYETQGVKFARWDGKSSATDVNGRTWTLTEAALTRAGVPPLPRASAHRAFWFGWVAQFPETRLVK
jgi:hypothetical protein